MWKWILVLIPALGLMGCSGNNLASSLSSGSTDSSSLYSKSTSELTSEATSEVADNDSCQQTEPDFTAVQEALIAKLTELVDKLEAVDTSNFTSEQLEKHTAFLVQVKADLETVTNASELTDELKEIIRKVWHHHHQDDGKDSRGPRHGPPPEEGACHAAVKAKHKDGQCFAIEQILAATDLTDTLGSALEERYASQCSDSDSSTDSSSESTN